MTTDFIINKDGTSWVNMDYFEEAVRKAAKRGWDEGNYAGCDRSENHHNPYEKESPNV